MEMKIQSAKNFLPKVIKSISKNIMEYFLGKQVRNSLKSDLVSQSLPNMKTALITGAAGYLGSHLAKSLKKLGGFVKAISQS